MKLEIIVCLLTVGTLFINEKVYNIFLVILAILFFKPNYINIINGMIGFWISPFITNLFIQIINFRVIPINRGYILKEELILKAITEELLWRELFFQYILLDRSIYMCVINIIIFSFLFLGTHKIKNKKNFVEMFCYTTLLYFSAFVFPGMNYGLHIGRNCYIDYCNGGM